MPYCFASWLHPANPRPLLSRYCQLYSGFPDVDKKQDGILKLSLQKRWVCGQSPERRLGELRFGSRLPVGHYTSHLEKGFLILVLQSCATGPSGRVCCMPGVESGSPCSALGNLGPAQESQNPAEEEATEVTATGTQKKKERCLDPQPCLGQAQFLALKILLCAQDPRPVTLPCS